MLWWCQVSCWAGGKLSKRVVVATVNASPKAVQKVVEAGGEVLTIPDLVRRFPRGEQG
jgi:large subunit ribosomal protein L18e